MYTFDLAYKNNFKILSNMITQKTNDLTRHFLQYLIYFPQQFTWLKNQCADYTEFCKCKFSVA